MTPSRAASIFKSVHWGTLSRIPAGPGLSCLIVLLFFFSFSNPDFSSHSTSNIGPRFQFVVWPFLCYILWKVQIAFCSKDCDGGWASEGDVHLHSSCQIYPHEQCSRWRNLHIQPSVISISKLPLWHPLSVMWCTSAASSPVKVPRHLYMSVVIV